jgi:methyl-accepting chemotaxis protein
MATRRKRTSERPPSSTSAGRVTILLEQIQEQNGATIEAVQSQGTSIRREMGEVERRLAARIDALEAAVRQNSADIRQNSADIRLHSEQLRRHSEQIEASSADIRHQADELRKVREQLAELTGVVRGKPDAAALEALEARVTNLERRVGI